MANTERLPEEALASIALQVGERIAGVAGDLLTPPPDINTLNANPSDMDIGSEERAAPSLDLGENFAVWMLGADDVRRGAQTSIDLMELARNTGQWHHQIRFDGKSLAYARSMLMGDEPESRSLCELSVSALAEEIQKALDWSDDEVPDDYLMRLLIVPAYHVRAFWFISEKNRNSFVYVISAPAQLEKLQLNTQLRSHEFLKALDGARPITGYR